MVGDLMSQSDVFELLKFKRLIGDDNYYSSIQIRKMLKSKGIFIGSASLNNNISSLRIFGYLDMKLNKLDTRNKSMRIGSVYRLNKSYL